MSSDQMRLLDLFCGGGGAAEGYHRAGFTDIVGVDEVLQPHYPFEFHQADAFEYLTDHWQEFDVIHGSPVCKGYSVMNNLPWLRDKVYPLQILPLREALNAIGKPYIIENVYGAKWGSKGLAKRGLQAHGMQAGWLCGTMFGKPFYRHRLFETNWFWLAPNHPKHVLNLHPRAERWVYGGSVRGLPGGAAGMDMKPKAFSETEDSRGLQSWPGRRGNDAGNGLTVWQNGAQGEGVGVGHAKGWRLAAQAMDINWMNRAELTQAIPPVYSAYIGRALMKEREREPDAAT